MLFVLTAMFALLSASYPIDASVRAEIHHDVEMKSSDPGSELLEVVGTAPVNGADFVPIQQRISILFDRDVVIGPNFTGILVQNGEETASVTSSVYGNQLLIAPVYEWTPSVTYSVYVPLSCD